jgi:hypothetical protein
VAVAVEPLSFTTLVTRPVLDPTAVLLCAVAGAAYLAATRRLAARGRSWPRARTAAFVAGLVTLAVATLSGLARSPCRRPTGPHRSTSCGPCTAGRPASWRIP